MEAFLGPIMDGGSSFVNTVTNLKENLESLEDAMERLKQVYEDVKERVEREEQLRRKRKRTNEVAGWLDRVQRMEAQVIVILQEGKAEEQKNYAIFSTYKVGKRVSKILNEVNELRAERDHFNVVIGPLVRSPFINEKPMEETVGLELMVEEVWRCIEDTDLRIIGLYGLGGVGKTTLLNKINNEFLNRIHGFEAVIWLSVSKQPDLNKMLEAILREFHWASEIGSILKGKKFVLLLDDIWERLDLAELGVPIQDMHQTGSKVVFTTRSLEICGLMEAQRKIKVECLTPEAALDLFRSKVGEDTLINQRISELAEIMAAECKGLPLALVTVGRAMASRKTPEEWEQAISILRNSPSQFPGMNDVLLLLKFSFDRLQNTTLKSCFLYCSIFPEDYNIRKEELIELWLGEGFLDEFVDCYAYEFGGLSNVRRKGEYIIGSLKLACLLESGESEEFVRMHQMIRDMALWECRDKVKIYVRRGPLDIRESHFFSRRGAQSTQAYGSESWNEIERISLWDHGIEDLPINHDTQFPNLLTLICKAPMLTTFPAGFFHLMPALTILDLSNSFLLRWLPVDIDKLINLQYLNVSGTALFGLPTKFGKLTKLRCLLLDDFSVELKSNFGSRYEISRETISNFQLLEVFSTSFCDEDLLDELEHLSHISEISIEISTAASYNRLLRSPKLQQCLKKLKFRDKRGLHFMKDWNNCGLHSMKDLTVSPSLLRRMEHLELNSTSLQEIIIPQEIGPLQHHYFDNLCRVVISNNKLSNATWLIHAPRLQHLKLSSCDSMKEVIAAEIEENADLFSSLKTLHLINLRVLEGISRHALTFPFLMEIKVWNCTRLKKLPFDSNSAKNSLKQIYGGRLWLDGLQWEDEAIKQVFSSKFLECPGVF